MALIKKDLFDTNAALYVLSCLMRNPLLLQDDRYAIVKTDFYKPLQSMVYYAIYNMAQTGASNITPQDIDLYLKQYDSQYEFYKVNKGYEFVLQCYQTTEGSDIKQFDFYYNRLKKFAVLRDLENAGIDTKRFYDTEKDALNKDQEDEKLNKISIDTILNSVRSSLVTIENTHIGKSQAQSQNAFKGLEALVQGFIDNPEVGCRLDGDIFNVAVRGARLGKLYVYSMPSGAGKTRCMMGNACALSLPYIDRDGKVVIRKDLKKVLFVATEMDATEIQTLLLSYVSMVNEKTILLGKYSPDEMDRIKKAQILIKEYQDNFLIECIPDPSIEMIKARLTKYIIQDEVEYIFYDYIFSSPGLLSEFRDVGVREDVALMMLSNSLKEIAMSYNVFIMSATQLNENWAKQEVGLRDQNCLRGSKAIADKIDIGAIGVRIPEKEWKLVEVLWQELKKQIASKFDPNLVVDVYKNRRGEMNCVKIFRYFDYATCHCYDLFVVDSSYRAFNVQEQFEYEVDKFESYDYCDLLMKRGESREH